MAPREGVVVGHRTAAVLVVLSLARARLAAACLARVDGLRPDDVEARQPTCTLFIYQRQPDAMRAPRATCSER